MLWSDKHLRISGVYTLKDERFLDGEDIHSGMFFLPREEIWKRARGIKKESTAYNNQKRQITNKENTWLQHACYLSDRV